MTKQRRKREISVTEAAEYLWAIFDEFKANNEQAQLNMRYARVLLAVCTDQAIAAVAANAKAGAPVTSRRPLTD